MKSTHHLLQNRNSLTCDYCDWQTEAEFEVVVAVELLLNSCLSYHQTEYLSVREGVVAYYLNDQLFPRHLTLYVQGVVAVGVDLPQLLKGEGEVEQRLSGKEEVGAALRDHLLHRLNYCPN